MGQVSSLDFEFFFVTFKLYSHHESYGNTQTRETKQEILYFFFLLLLLLSAGNLAQEVQ